MRLSCPTCAAAVPADDVNVTALVAKCRGCDEVFGFDTPGAVTHAPAPRRRPPLPKGVTIESGEPPLPSAPGYRTAPARQSGPLVIRRRWFRWHHLGMLVFCIFWDGFLINWYVLGASHGGPAIMFLFPLLHVGVGLGLTYTTLAGLLNRTTIRIADDRLTVKHEPLPWLGAVDMPASSLRQLYLRRTYHSRKNGGYYSWAVRAETEDSASIELVRRLRDRDQAEYIEWAIEEHLGILDDPSHDEIA